MPTWDRGNLTILAQSWVALGFCSNGFPLLAQEKVYQPASSHMRARSAAVAQHVGIGAPGFFEGISDDSKAGVVKRASRCAFDVGHRGQRRNRACLPSKLN